MFSNSQKEKQTTELEQEIETKIPLHVHQEKADCPSDRLVLLYLSSYQFLMLSSWFT